MANLNEMTNGQREIYRAQVCVAVGLNPDPTLAMLDYIWMPQETGPANLVLYARRGTCEILRDVNGVNVDSLEQHDGSGYVSFKATGKNKKGRQEIAVGAHETEGLKGKRLADAIATAQTRSLRRLTLQFAGYGILDESEVNAAIASTTVPAASTAQLSGSPMVIPPPPQAAPASAPGRDVTQPQTPEQFSAEQEAMRQDAIRQLKDKRGPADPENPIKGWVSYPEHTTVTLSPEKAISPNVETPTPSETPAKVKRTRKPRNTVSIASPGQTEMPVGHIDAQGKISEPLTTVSRQEEAVDTGQALIPPVAEKISTPAPEVPVSVPSAAVVEKAQPVPAQAPVAPPTAAVSPEKAAEFKNRLRVYSNDVLPKGGMLPSDGIGGVTMKLRKFASVHTGAADTSALSLAQWEDLFDFLDSYVQKNGSQELVKYIDKAIGVTK